MTGDRLRRSEPGRGTCESLSELRLRHANHWLRRDLSRAVRLIHQLWAERDAAIEELQHADIENAKLLEIVKIAGDAMELACANRGV